LVRLLTFIFTFLFSVSGFSASEETVQLPYRVEMLKPIIFSVKYLEQEAGVSIGISEDFFLTPLRSSKESVIYSVESAGARIDHMKGLPPSLEPVLKKLIEQASGLSYEYAADGTGYPLKVVASKEINTFMKKMASTLDDWLDKFAESKNIDSQLKSQMQSVLDEGMAPLLTKDDEELSRLILNELELIFAVTGRNLYIDYGTVYDNTRYFDDGELYMHTQDEWLVENQDKKGKNISISMSSTLHPEKHPEFVESLRENLKGEYSKEDVNAIVDIWANMELSRQSSYEVDMTTGLPTSGQITSKTVFNGEQKLQKLEFTSSY